MSSRRSHFTLVALIATAVAAALMLALPGSPIFKKPTLGLDLQGGLELVYKAVPPRGHQLTTADLNRSRDIIEQRVNGLGISEPDVRTQPPNEIVVQLAGVHDPAKAAKIVGSTAQLQIFDYESSVIGPSKSGSGPVPTQTLYDLLSKANKVKSLQKGLPQAYYLFRTKTKTTTTTVPSSAKKFKTTTPKTKTTTTTVHSLVSGPLPRLSQLLAPYHGKVPKGTEVVTAPGGTEAVACKSASQCLPGWYLFKLPPALKGTDLQLSQTRADVDPNTGQPVVLLGFTSKGAKAFQEITKAEYQRGQQNAALAGQAGNTNTSTVTRYAGHSAIVLDNVIRSLPYINYTDSSLSDGISGGAQITTTSMSDAKQLALVLQTGALPVSFEQIERTDVSATLGKDSLRQAWHAAAVGLVVVALFLLLVYRFLGLVAVLGLGIYGALYYAAILLFGVTLTLPGFAGLILTIGVAADANVVIFERIKEEVRAGKSVRAAIAAGYGKGFHTILDANVVTAITALVLFAVAQANVRGFALMLLIGTVISLLTAVAATRALLGVLADFRWFGNARFMGAHGQQRARWLQIDFMKRRYLWFALSGVIIAVGATALGVRGLNLGIDFKGGTQMTFRTAEPVRTGTVQSVLTKQGRPDAVVQGRGTAAGNGGYKEFQIRTKHLTNNQQTELVGALGASAHLTGQPDVKTVSASFGRQIARDAIIAIIVSLALIVLYIAIRFDFKFAGPVIVAMLHDIVITVGVYALVGREVSTSTVAAVLTVLGYSIYDTIIIFDRIRENVPLMRRSSFATIANVSLWETIRRSLATTLITLLPITALLVLGGATLKDFAFALLVGITSGAYSSIFIAAPLLTIWKEREPDWVRRKGQDEPEPERGGDGGRPARRRRRLPLGGPATDPGTVALQESEHALADEPTPALLDIDPEPAPPSKPAPAQAGSSSNRERRRQRRRARPHGRAR